MKIMESIKEAEQRAGEFKVGDEFVQTTSLALRNGGHHIIISHIRIVETNATGLRYETLAILEEQNRPAGVTAASTDIYGTALWFAACKYVDSGSWVKVDA